MKYFSNKSLDKRIKEIASQSGGDYSAGTGIEISDNDEISIDSDYLTEIANGNAAYGYFTGGVLQTTRDPFWEVGSPSDLVGLKSGYNYVGAKKGLIFTDESDKDHSPADLMRINLGTASEPVYALYTPHALITGGDQIVGSGTPGGGGGGGAVYLSELLDVEYQLSPSIGDILIFSSNKFKNPDGTSSGNVWSHISKADYLDGYATTSYVDSAIGSIVSFTYQIAASTSAVTNPQSNVLYLIGPTGTGSDKYEEYVYPDSTTGWVKIGDTSIDLSGYVTSTALSTWAGSSYITTVGTISSGTWGGTEIPVAKGGTGKTSIAAYSMLYASAANTYAELLANTSSTKKFLAMTGTGSAGAAPSWSTIAQADVLGSSSIGSGTNPIYYSGSDLTASTSTVGSSSLPVYLNNGTISAITDLDLLSQTNGYVKANRVYLYESGNTAIYFEYDSTNGYVKLNTSLLTTGDQIVGSGTPGGGGGGGAGYLYELGDIYHDTDKTKVLRDPDYATTTGQQAQPGDVLVLDSTHGWAAVPSASIGGVTSVVGQTGDVTAAQISTAIGLGDYLPLSAGSSYPLTGFLVVNSGDTVPIIMKGASAQVVAVYNDGTTNRALTGWHSSYGAYMYNYTSNKVLNITDAGALLYNTYTVYHSGNFVAGTDYLPMIGGVISNADRFPLVINDSRSTDTWVGLGYRINSVHLGCLGFSSAGDPVYANASGTLKKLWHEGNFTPGDYLPLSLSSTYYITRSDDNWVLYFKNTSSSGGSHIGFYKNTNYLGTVGFDDSGNLVTYGGSPASYRTVYHSGNSNKSDVPWACSTLTANAVGSRIAAYSASALSASSDLGGTALEVGAINGFGLYLWTDGSGKGFIQEGRTTGTTRYDLVFQPFGGNVGLGTSSPDTKLSVYSGSGSAWAGSISSDYARIYLAYSYYGMSVNSLSSSSSYYLLDMRYNCSNVNGSGGSTALHVGCDGMMGVGTASPACKLDVLAAYSSPTYTAKIKNSSYHTGVCLETVWPYNPYIDFVGDGTVRTQMGYSYQYNAFYIGQNGTATPMLYIDYANSRVGIGTGNSLAYTLDVNGTVNASAYHAAYTGKSISTAGWYRVYSGTIGSAIVLIENNYNNNRTCLVTLNINAGYNGDAQITQVGGYGSATQVFTKARVVFSDATHWHLDIYYAVSSANYLYITGIGAGEPITPTAETLSPSNPCEINIAPGRGMSVGDRLLVSGPISASGSARDLITMDSTDANGPYVAMKLNGTLKGRMGCTSIGPFLYNQANSIELGVYDTGFSFSFNGGSTAHVSITSGGNISAAGTITASSTIVAGGSLGLSGTSGNGSYGLSLYNGAAYHKYYGIWVGLSSVGGTHGSVTGNFNMYFTCSNGSTRGFIFRVDDASNVASISNSGILTTNGDQVISSDLVWKTNLQPVKYTIQDIAKCRAVTFDWKDGRGKSAGSIAQDWKGLIPELVHGEEGNMTLAYGQIAMINSILNARAIVDIQGHETEQDKEINRLKKKVKELENELKRLRS